MKNRRDYPNQEIRGEEKSTLSGEGFIQDSLFEKIPFGENPGMGFLKTEASAAIRNAQWEKARIPKQWKWWKKKQKNLPWIHQEPCKHAWMNVIAQALPRSESSKQSIDLESPFEIAIDDCACQGERTQRKSVIQSYQKSV